MSEKANINPRAAGRRRVLLGATAAASGIALLGTAQPALADSTSRVVDEGRIRQLSVNYALGTDAIGRNDKPAGLALYAKTFTDRAEIMVAGAPSTLRIGGAAWADFVESVFRGSHYDRTQHLIGTINVLLGDGREERNRATMSTYLHATHHVQDNASVLIVLGTYDDVVVRHGNDWRIARRTLSVMTSWTETPA